MSAFVNWIETEITITALKSPSIMKEKKNKQKLLIYKAFVTQCPGLSNLTILKSEVRSENSLLTSRRLLKRGKPVLAKVIPEKAEHCTVRLVDRL